MDNMSIVWDKVSIPPGQNVHPPLRSGFGIPHGQYVQPPATKIWWG